MHTGDRVSVDSEWVQLDLIQRSSIPHNIQGKEDEDLGDDLAEEGQSMYAVSGPLVLAS
jgi:hypothetical protein